MKLEEQLLERNNNNCEICQSGDSLTVYEVLPQSGNTPDNCFMVCDTCLSQIDQRAEMQEPLALPNR